MNGQRVKDRIYLAYVACMLTLADEEMPDACRDDISPGLGCDIEADIQLFLNQAPDLTGVDPEHIGHDLYLTRNGHGAGFWDRPEIYGGQGVADRLTEIAQGMGEMSPYLGDDGLVYA